MVAEPQAGPKNADGGSLNETSQDPLGHRSPHHCAWCEVDY